MSGLKDIIFKPGEPEARLTSELERFSFGIAVSTFAEVTPVEGPDSFVKTVAHLGGVGIDHAQHPETKQQNIVVSGKDVSPQIDNVPFIFDTYGQFLMAGFGPPLPGEVVSEVADAVQKLNDNFDEQASP